MSDSPGDRPTGWGMVTGAVLLTAVCAGVGICVAVATLATMTGVWNLPRIGLNAVFDSGDPTGQLQTLAGEVRHMRNVASVRKLHRGPSEPMASTSDGLATVTMLAGTSRAQAESAARSISRAMARTQSTAVRLHVTLRFGNEGIGLSAIPRLNAGRFALARELTAIQGITAVGVSWAFSSDNGNVDTDNGASTSWRRRLPQLSRLPFSTD